MKATVYTGDGCTACRQAVTWLKAQGVEVVEKNHAEAPMPIYGLPMIEIGYEVVTGFNKTLLTEILGGRPK